MPAMWWACEQEDDFLRNVPIAVHRVIMHMLFGSGPCTNDLIGWGEHRVAFFAVLGFFALFVGASRMVGAMSKDQIVQEAELTKVVERIGSIDKNLQ